MPATGMGPGSPSGTGGPGSLGGSGQGSQGGASGGGGGEKSPTKPTKPSTPTKPAGGGNQGGTGGAGEKSGGSINTISSAPQNNRQTTVSPAQSPAQSSSFFPSTPAGGGAPNGSGVVGFPANGYLSGDAETLDAVDLAELLHQAQQYGSPDYSGDVGADFLDDNLTYGEKLKATAKNPIVWLAAAGLVGIAAFAIFPMKAA